MKSKWHGINVRRLAAGIIVSFPVPLVCCKIDLFFRRPAGAPALHVKVDGCMFSPSRQTEMEIPI
jgi:hypothetical protein